MLHRVALAIEAYVVNATAIYHGFSATGDLIERVVSIERAEVYPTVVAFGGELVLQLNMVEAGVVHVETINRHRQVVADGILWRQGVHNPVVMGCGDIHFAAYGNIMDREAGFAVCSAGSAGASQHEANVVIVVVVGAGTHLDCLVDDVRAVETNAATIAERHSVDAYPGTVGVAAFVQCQLKHNTFSNLACSPSVVGLDLVPHLYVECCRPVFVNIVHLVAVKHNLGVLNLACAEVHGCARIVDQCGVWPFPRTACCATHHAIDERAIEVAVGAVLVKV